MKYVCLQPLNSTGDKINVPRTGIKNKPKQKISTKVINLDKKI